MSSVKDEVERLMKERGWITFNELLKLVNRPAPEVNDALIQLMKENKITRHGRYFHYVQNSLN